MATDQDKPPKVPLKLLVDEKRNRVVAAEVSKDFVDILFSFLTLPMGTIMRITGNQKFAGDGLRCGMFNLYQSVEGLADENFSSKERKHALQYQRQQFARICMNLKVKVDDSSSVKYYRCNSWSCNLMSMEYCARCSCGGAFNGEYFPSPQLGNDNECGGVFLKGGMAFIVSDDLQVTLCSPGSLVVHLSNLGLTDMTQVTEMSVEAGIEEISSLLKCSLISKSPLTDVFLVKQGKTANPIMPEPSNLSPSSFMAHKGTTTGQLSLKLVLRRSTNKILYAESSDDFINFLFSFLIIPLGSVVEHLRGQTGLECIDNLHRSVKKLEPKWLRYEKWALLNAGGCRHRNQPEILCLWDVMGISVSAEEQISFSGRFVKAPSLFLVSDNLEARDLSSTSCIGFLKELNVPFSDIEERMVTLGEAEALGILKASLTSSLALTNGLNFLLKKHKLEE